MRRVLGNPIIKAVAVLLFIAFSCVLWLDFVKFVDYVNLGVYDEREFDGDNSKYSELAGRLGHKVQNDIEVLVIKSMQEGADIDFKEEFELILEEKFPTGTNLQFVIYDTAHNVLYSDYTGETPCNGGLILDIYNDYGTTHYNFSEYDILYRDEEKKNSYVELGFVNLYVADVTKSDVYDEFTEYYETYQTGVSEKYAVLTTAAVSVIVMLLSLGWVIASAGYSGKEGPAKLRFYDRIPLEIFLAVYILLVCFVVIALNEFHYYEEFLDYLNYIFIPGILVSAPLVLVFFASIANRFKTGTFFKNTVTAWLLKLLWKLLKKCWALFGKAAVHIPMVWRTVISFALYCLATLILLSEGFQDYNDMAIIAWILLNILTFGYLCWKAIILYQLKKGGERIYCGDYDSKIDTSIMYLDYKKFAEQLNSVGKGLNSAVEERMKSERMKSELITNVSHDLKTPLTSIINYVDLLKNEDKNSPKADEYIEVLDRQAKRLKKLTEDLIFAAKASSGTEKVNLEQINISEFVGQAIAEYSGKTDKADLTVITAAHISSETTAKADGRLLWRIMDNIFGNVCKYAQPGTRVYVETTETEKTVTIAVKNISKEQLNISADELMQRFVRGDSSRSSEGSGLGLSIARDLALLQDGLFDITVDGDLFKSAVTLRKN